MLFSNHQRKTRPQGRHVVMMEEPARLPDFLRQLERLCHDHHHPLPCRMTFIGPSTSDKGRPMAMYACPLCNYREGWVADYRTGQPWRLFSRPGQGSASQR